MAGTAIRLAHEWCVMAGAGSKFSLQAELRRVRLKPELQTGHAQRMAGRYEDPSLRLAWVNMLTTTATGKRAAELAEADLFASVPERNYLGLQDADGFLLG